jgi:serine protease Do
VPAATRGVVIGSVDPSSDAASKGLRRGDVILSANGRPVVSAEELRAAVAEAGRAGRSTVLVLVQRGNNPPRYAGLRIKEG